MVYFVCTLKSTVFPLFFYYELLLCYAYLCGINWLKAIKLNNMKTKLLASMLVFGAMNASAQLTVYHNGNVLFYRFQNLQGNVFSFEQIPNEFTVCVTKDGFVPYCVNVLKQDDGNLYLQNVTFDGNTTVVGKKIIAGRDVKRGSAQGPVRILNGNVSLQAEQTVRLKNSFRVEKGASLQVHTNLK